MDLVSIRGPKRLTYSMALATGLCLTPIYTKVYRSDLVLLNQLTGVGVQHLHLKGVIG